MLFPMLRETWADMNTKAVWEWDGRMWVKIGYRKVGWRNYQWRDSK